MFRADPAGGPDGGRSRTVPVGAQWPMIISGGLSVLAGASFAATSGSATSGLSHVADYSAFGAFWKPSVTSNDSLSAQRRTAAARSWAASVGVSSVFP